MEKKIIKLLKDPLENKWQTSLSLSSKLKKYKSCSPEQIESILINYIKTNINSEIRYSSLPSKKSLHVLWGHIDKVGKRKLFDIFKEDKQTTATYLNNVNDERNIFLSHSFKDTDKVFNLAHKLVVRGFNPWIAESDIQQGNHINHDVINAIKELPYFGIYLSKNVLKSAWSAKEFEFALLHKKKLMAFVDEDDNQIINLIEKNISIDNYDIHSLLRKIFGFGELSEYIDFFIVTKIERENLNYKRIKKMNNLIL